MMSAELRRRCDRDGMGEGGAMALRWGKEWCDGVKMEERLG
ncbi:hypothetical protein L195_g043347, partial [Trifolium pratense]